MSKELTQADLNDYAGAILNLLAQARHYAEILIDRTGRHQGELALELSTADGYMAEAQDAYWKFWAGTPNTEAAPDPLQALALRLSNDDPDAAMSLLNRAQLTTMAVKEDARRQNKKTQE